MKNIRKTAGDVTIEKLIDEGWTISHSALVSAYRFAGTVSKMQTRKGFEFCRVHHGKCVGSRSWQITTVMRRAIPAT